MPNEPTAAAGLAARNPGAVLRYFAEEPLAEVETDLFRLIEARALGVPIVVACGQSRWAPSARDLLEEHVVGSLEEYRPPTHELNRFCRLRAFSNGKTARMRSLRLLDRARVFRQLTLLPWVVPLLDNSETVVQKRAAAVVELLLGAKPPVDPEDLVRRLARWPS
ncbi:MAG TPA: hypothetical protein VFF73_20885 [Planctomycetota bacterium]|nr:hypothetical protein [Planctomycetota bacterium]